MAKYGKKKSRLSESPKSGNTSKSTKTTKIKKVNISSQFSSLFESLSEYKFKIIITTSIILLIILFIKTCGGSCKSNNSENIENTKQNEMIDPEEKNEDDKVKNDKKKRKTRLRKTSKKTAYKKPKTYSKSVDETAVKKKKAQDPNFGTSIDIIE